MSDKLRLLKKERDDLKLKTIELENEVMQLQSHMQSMVPGVVGNTSEPFPMVTEMQNLCHEFFISRC